MKFTIERATLLRSLAHVHNIVERRTTIPILSNVKLQAQGDRLSLTATDLDIAVRESTTAAVAQEGAITVSAHIMHDIIRKLPDGAQVDVALADDGGRVTVSAGRSRFQLACLPVDDFPAMAEEDLAVQFVISAEDLKRLLDKTRFAVSTEETRYYLNGIFLHVAETAGVKMLRAVATDGHRLAQVELPAPNGADDLPGIIVPRKTVQELRKLLDEIDGDVAVAASEAKIRFTFDEVVLTSKLIDGTFPDYTRVIPADNDKTLEVDSRLFAEAVDRVSTISSEKSRAVKLNMEKDLIVLSVSSSESGSATEELAANYAATPVEIGFNARYLLDIAGQIDGDSAVFKFLDAHSPTLVHDSGDDAAQYVLMPMRV